MHGFYGALNCNNPAIENQEMEITFFNDEGTTQHLFDAPFLFHCADLSQNEKSPNPKEKPAHTNPSKWQKERRKVLNDTTTSHPVFKKSNTEKERQSNKPQEYLSNASDNVIANLSIPISPLTPTFNCIQTADLSKHTCTPTRRIADLSKNPEIEICFYPSQSPHRKPFRKSVPHFASRSFWKPRAPIFMH